MPDKKQLVAIYCRLAHEDDLEMQAQRRTMHAFAESLGFQDCAEYADNGYSGRTLDRPSFMKMMGEVRAGNVQVVFVRNISRICRDIVLYNNWMRQIQSRNVTVISTQENICRDYLNRIRKS